MNATSGDPFESPEDSFESPEDPFESPEEISRRLAEVGYLADQAIATTVSLAAKLGKPVLVEGPAGTGKTQLAKSVSEMVGRRLVRLQCYEGLDEAKALYEWDYRKQLLRIQAQQVGKADRTLQRTLQGESTEQAQAEESSESWKQLEEDIFSEEFLLSRPLLEAVRCEDPIVLLVDEVDRVELETEALMLEVLSEYQVSIPELGTIKAKSIPMVFLTSNNTRELSEALKRRCLYLYLDYPTIEREREIVRVRVPEVETELADQIVRIVRSLRAMDLKKHPSVSETLDWARTLVLLGVQRVDPELAKSTLNVLLKYKTDVAKAQKELSLGAEA